MYHKIGKFFCRLCNNYLTQINLRCMTTTEVSAALRPFYFAVHPDLFGQHPSERSTNENSLKHLSSYFETLHRNGLFKPCELQFYMRKKEQKDEFRLITIKLNEKNIKRSVLTILKSCDLSTEFVDKIPTPTSQSNATIDFSNTSEDDTIFEPIIMTRRMQEFREKLILDEWLNENYKTALLKSKNYQPVRDEINRLRKKWKDKLNMIDIRWDCDWNEMQFRGCLRSFDVLAKEHPIAVQKLKERVLVFSSFTGVSLDGHVMLFNGEVRHNWLDLIKNIKKYDSILLRIPDFEKAVSQVLRDIKVVRRKFMPKIMAGEYERHLLQITTAISDYLCRNRFPETWPESLKNYQIVVESEAGPLMVSPTGQFIVPSSCPGFLLVNFITDNHVSAKDKIENYQKNKHVEISLHEECVKQLQLASLRKEDNVNPDIMITCCEKLLLNKNKLQNLKSVHLNISTYYSVLDDGIVCIPWNWQL